MHIAIDVRSLMEGRHSGVEEYTTQIIRSMSEVAPTHTYYVFYNSRRSVTLPSFRKNVVVRSFSYPNKLFNASQWLFSFPTWDRLIDRPIDAVFVPNPRLTPLFSRIPLVSVVHDLSFEKFPEFLTVRRRMWHRMMRPASLLHSSSHVIAVSQHTKGDVSSLYGIDPSHISVVYSGIREDIRAARPVEVHNVRYRYGLPEHFLLFMGTLEPRKNVASVIQAFEAIASHVSQDVVISGEKGWKEEYIRSLIEKSPVKERIHVIGFVEEKFKSALYTAADLFVYPSFYEGFGFPPLEAMLCGTPAVASYNSSVPEVAGEWATLVDPYNTQQLAAVLEEQLTTPTRVPESVRQQIREKYSWHRAARETLKILESVA